ncbi:MAG: chromosomal replication initiator protein DnaA [Gemmatimonadetes bacterium]|nr:MAG: chromosomal replication initiator protein DnaA [Gemmatimonadota bacterium]
MTAASRSGAYAPSCGAGSVPAAPISWTSASGTHACGFFSCFAGYKSAFPSLLLAVQKSVLSKLLNLFTTQRYFKSRPICLQARVLTYPHLRPYVRSPFFLSSVTLSATEVWSTLIGRARLELPEQAVETWLVPLVAQEFDGRMLVLTAPDQWSVEWNESKHTQALEALGPVCFGHPISISFRVEQERLKRSQMDLFAPANSATIPPLQRPHSVTIGILSKRYTFSEFVVGRSNELAVAAATAVSQAPGKTYNPLFIYGATGLGKTHLMQAIAHEILAKNPSCRTTLISTEQFTNDVITSIAKRAMPDFRRRYRETDLLLVDDVHFLGGKEATQEEFFHTFNAIYEAGRQVVVTSDRPPSEIPRLESRLVSRFEWGMVADIAQPDLEHRIAILRQKARADRLEQAIPDDVIEFVANHVQANVRELEGSIIKLLAYASLRNRPVSLDIAREALRDKVRTHESRPARSSRHDRLRSIQQRVATEWGVSVEGLQAKSRTRAVTVPRQVAMYLSRELLGLQLVEIGGAFGGRDHSTVIHSLDRVSSMIKESVEFRGRVEKIRDSLRNDT